MVPTKKILIGLLSLFIVLTSFVMPAYAAPASSSGNTITVKLVIQDVPSDTTEFSITLKKDNAIYANTKDVAISQSNIVTFANLPSGKYTLQQTLAAGYENVSINPTSISVKGKNNSYNSR